MRKICSKCGRKGQSRDFDHKLPDFDTKFNFLFVYNHGVASFTQLFLTAKFVVDDKMTSILIAYWIEKYRINYAQFGFCSKWRSSLCNERNPKSKASVFFFANTNHLAFLWNNYWVFIRNWTNPIFRYSTDVKRNEFRSYEKWPLTTSSCRNKIDFAVELMKIPSNSMRCDCNQ